MRSELTATQQAEHLAKRKELWRAREVSGQIDPKPRGGRPQGFAGATEEATGTDKRVVNRAVARAEKIPEDIRDEIRGTDLDKGVVLDDIARTPPERQRDRLGGSETVYWEQLPLLGMIVSTLGHSKAEVKSWLTLTGQARLKSKPV